MPDNQKQFVIQQHSRGGNIHWDLMLEQNGSLQTFRLDTPPDELNDRLAEAIKIDDHELRFLKYQGPVNNGAGNVRIAESGTYIASSTSDERIELNIKGSILKGQFTLTHFEEDRWQFAAAKH